MLSKEEMDSKFHLLLESPLASEIQQSLPVKFTYPFAYEIDPIALKASEDLQCYLQSQNEFDHDFGLDHFVEGTNVGKMFGVLVVKNAQGDLGYLAAFSGKLAGSNDWSFFVPPIADILQAEGFYRKGEGDLEKLTARIKSLVENSELKERWVKAEALKEKEIQELKTLHQFNKSNRAKQRAAFLDLNSNANEAENEAFKELQKELLHESLKDQKELKDLKKNWRLKLEEIQNEILKVEQKIDLLKKERRQLSNQLQKQIFDQYQFLNPKGELKSLWDIFADTPLKTPPSGAGDCAAPKLLQYAFQKGYEPIALGEFWWGQAPKAELRRHKHFYPACKGKCQPILTHMLNGVELDENPMLTKLSREFALEVIYEDEFFAVVNKPAEFLSVPGNILAPSMFELAKKQWPKATGPLMVHRLDMSTSGLLMVAKSDESYKKLQQLFISRKMKKTYRAILEGKIDSENSLQGEINLPLATDYINRPRQKVDPIEGKPALTLFEVMASDSHLTEVKYFPQTGRTHQLRVHSAHPDGLNAPILGDDLYGKRSKRLYLHAEKLEFLHPFTRVEMKIESELPWDFVRIASKYNHASTEDYKD